MYKLTLALLLMAGVLLSFTGVFLSVRKNPHLSSLQAISWRRSLWMWRLVYGWLTGNREMMEEAKAFGKQLHPIGWIGVILVLIAAVIGILAGATR